MDVVGFIGLGIMGHPMALNLWRAGWLLVVWNRSAEGCRVLAEAGALVAQTPAAVFAKGRYGHPHAGRPGGHRHDARAGDAGFAPMVRGRTGVCMGSSAPDRSRRLGADIVEDGGSYVEAPMSGQFVGLLGGDPATVNRVRPILAPMCRATIACGTWGWPCYGSPATFCPG